jgi:hypothetical protein
LKNSYLAVGKSVGSDFDVIEYEFNNEKFCRRVLLIWSMKFRVLAGNSKFKNLKLLKLNRI